MTRRNLVEASLVRSAVLVRDLDAPGQGIVGVPEKFIARVRIQAPSSDEALTAQMAAQIENRLAGIEAISRTELELLPPLFPMLR
ncbi:MAG: DUF59 domain-containing protein [Acidobacteriaceae bacterium]|nr:DUF59 domain-containing protein [Acidobacteriaceae bacterium]